MFINNIKLSKPSTSDILAGLTLAALGIPEVMGYTKIIGTPVITGLYTMLFPILAFAAFGSSRHLVVAADSATAAIVASALAGLSLSGDLFLFSTSAIALMAAGMLMLARIFRLGFLANFLSRTVLIGFLTGVGIQVALGQLHGLMGLDKPPGGFFQSLSQTLLNVPQTQFLCLAIGLGVLLILILSEVLVPRFPSALVVVVGMICASAVFNFEHLGLKQVGEVPRGLPRGTWPIPDLHLFLSLLSVSFSCCVVILAQSAATSRAFANRYLEPFSEDRDLIGLCAANLAAALSGTFVVNGSPTKTAIVDRAGGRSQWAHATAALVVGLVLLFLTRPLSYLPEVVLAAIVFRIGISLIDWKGMADLARQNRREFFLALLTSVTVVGFGVMPGILLALSLSLALHVQHSYKPHTHLTVRDSSGRWLTRAVETQLQAAPGFLVYWFGADLFYANCGFFSTEVKRLAGHASPPVRWLVIDAGAITSLDYTAEKTLLELNRYLSTLQIELLWVHEIKPLREHLRRLGLLQTDRQFETLHECLTTYLARS